MTGIKYGIDSLGGRLTVRVTEPPTADGWDQIWNRPTGGSEVRLTVRATESPYSLP